MSNDPNHQSSEEREPSQKAPSYKSVHDYLLFSLSVPERALRSATSVVGGALRESTSLLVPQAFQTSKTYTIFVTQMLDFMVEDIGGVQRPEDGEGPPKIDNFVARKTIGNFVELAGLATFHLSPMTLLAIVSDVAYGSQTYLKELSDDLKKQGVIDQDSTIDHVDDLLVAVASASATTASAFDTPPLSVDGLRETISDTRKAVGQIDPTKVIPQAEMKRLWDDIHFQATSQGVDPLAVSSAMTLYSLDKIGTVGQGALSTVRAAGTLFDRHIVDHYTDALADINEKGIYGSLAESSRPYVDAVWQNFSTDKATVTEDLLSGKLLGQAWGATRRWLGVGE